MMSRLFRLPVMAASVVGLFAAASVEAQTFTCRVLPKSYLGLNSDGVVYVGVEPVGILGVCSLKASFAGVSPEACRGWYSAFLTWRETGRSGWFYFNSGTPENSGIGSCASFSQWDVRIPYHLEGAQ